MPKKLQSGEDIRREREKLKLSIEKLAYLLDVSVATLSRWERGVVKPSPLVLRGIQGFFDDYRESKKERR